MDIDAIIAYENGELDEEATIALFQSLVDSGMAWSLQGSYGRTASDLISDGLVTADRGSLPWMARERIAANERAALCPDDDDFVRLPYRA